MADRAEDAYHLSDDDLDDIVGAIEADEDVSTDDPADGSQAPDPDEGGQADDDPNAASASDSGEDEPDDEAEGSQAAPAAGVSAAPAKPAAPASPPAPGTAQPAAAPAPASAPPFQFNASKQTHALAGAVALPDGSVLIQKDAVPSFRDLLGREYELRNHFADFQRQTHRQLAASKQERTDKDIEADAVIDLFEKFTKMSPEERWDWFEQFEKNRPELQLQVERQKLERDRKALEEARNPTVPPEELAQRRTTALVGALNTTFQKAMQHPSLMNLTDEEKRAAIQVYQKHKARLDRLVRKGDATKGEPDAELYDDSEVVEDLNLIARLRARAAAAAAPVAPAPANAAARNAQRNADLPVNRIPPAPRRGVPTGTPKGKGQKAYSGKPQQFKKDFMAGSLDSD